MHLVDDKCVGFIHPRAVVIRTDRPPAVLMVGAAVVVRRPPVGPAAAAAADHRYVVAAAGALAEPGEEVLRLDADAGASPHLAACIGEVGLPCRVVETRTGALTMLVASRGADGAKVAEAEELVRRVVELEARLKALEEKR